MPIIKEDDFISFKDALKKGEKQGVTRAELEDAISKNIVTVYAMHPVYKKKMRYIVNKVIDDGTIQGRFLDD